MPSDISMMYDMYYNHLQSPFNKHKDKIEELVTDAFEGTNVKVIEIGYGLSPMSFIVKFGFLGFTINIEAPIEFLLEGYDIEICRDYYMNHIMDFLKNQLLKG